MAFDAAYDKINDILTRRSDELVAGSRRTWALKTGETLKAQIDDTFERSADNAAWRGLFDGSGVGADVSLMAYHAARVAFCAAANRDLRTQYARGLECTPRSAVHIHMNTYTQRLAMRRALERFHQVNSAKGTKISKPATEAA